jgi:hypothetical protein
VENADGATWDWNLHFEGHGSDDAASTPARFNTRVSTDDDQWRVTLVLTGRQGERATLTVPVQVAKLPDTTKPSISAVADVRAFADESGGDGTHLDYDLPEATDDRTAHPDVACSPASGSFFEVGTTTVTCTATDDSGNTASGSFDVVVSRDTTAPVITLDPASDTILNPGDTFTVTATADDAQTPVEGMELYIHGFGGCSDGTHFEMLGDPDPSTTPAKTTSGSSISATLTMPTDADCSLFPLIRYEYTIEARATSLGGTGTAGVVVKLDLE